MNAPHFNGDLDAKFLLDIKIRCLAIRAVMLAYKLTKEKPDPVLLRRLREELTKALACTYGGFDEV